VGKVEVTRQSWVAIIRRLPRKRLTGATAQVKKYYQKLKDR
jgi:hypothetical protein